MELDYNPRAKECIDRAKQICKELGGTAVQPMDVFLSTMLARYDVIQMFLTHCTSDPVSLIQSAADYCSDLKRSPRKKVSWKKESSVVINAAFQEAERLQTPYIGVDHIFSSCIRNSAQVKEFLSEININAEEFYKIFHEFVKSLHEHKEPAPHQGPSQNAGSTSNIDKFCDHINSRVLDNKFQFFGRMDEINAAMTALCRRQKSNVLFVGEAGVGKTALVEGLALAMENPYEQHEIAFPRMEIFELKLSDMVAGATYRGDFEKRLNQTVEELKAFPTKAVVFIDEIHMLIGAGDKDGAMDAANILKPALAKGELSCIGATTYAEYKKYIEKDAALSRRFEVIHVKEPDIKETIDILKHCKKNFEEYHSVKFSDEAIASLVEAADTHMPYRRFPDKAFDLLDEAGTFLKLRLCKRPEHINKLENELKGFISSDNHKGQSGKYDKKMEVFRSEMEKWTEEISKDTEASLEDVRRFISHKFKLKKDDKGLEDFLAERVFGQKNIIKEFSSFEKVMTLQRRKNRPVFSALFAGGEGVGKTLFVSQYAEHGPLKQDGLACFDMSHYAEPTTINKLIGSSAGYVGYDRGGVLTEKLKNNPKLILLFENIDKAHPAILDLLVNMLNDGFLQDNIGQKIDCSRAKIFFTTRHTARTESLGFGGGASTLSIDTKRVPRDILGAVDKAWIFNDLEKDGLAQIGRERLRENPLSIGADDEVFEFLSDSCSPKGGARPMISKVEESIIGAVYDKLDDKNKNAKFYAKMLDKSIIINILESDE